MVASGCGCTTGHRTRHPRVWTGSRYYGDEELNRWIGQHRLDIVLCGHVHQSPFMAHGSWIDRIGTTTVFNAGRQPGRIPTHIEVDTATGLARWSSMEGQDEQTLTRA